MRKFDSSESHLFYSHSILMSQALGSAVSEQGLKEYLEECFFSNPTSIHMKEKG